MRLTPRVFTGNMGIAVVEMPTEICRGQTVIASTYFSGNDEIHPPPKKVVLLNIYTPTVDAENKTKYVFYRKLQERHIG